MKFAKLRHVVVNEVDGHALIFVCQAFHIDRFELTNLLPGSVFIARLNQRIVTLRYVNESFPGCHVEDGTQRNAHPCPPGVGISLDSYFRFFPRNPAFALELAGKIVSCNVRCASTVNTVFEHRIL